MVDVSRRTEGSESGGLPVRGPSLTGCPLHELASKTWVAGQLQHSPLWNVQCLVVLFSKRRTGLLASGPRFLSLSPFFSVTQGSWLVPPAWEEGLCGGRAGTEQHPGVQGNMKQGELHGPRERPRTRCSSWKELRFRKGVNQSHQYQRNSDVRAPTVDWAWSVPSERLNLNLCGAWLRTQPLSTLPLPFLQPPLLLGEES